MTGRTRNGTSCRTLPIAIAVAVSMAIATLAATEAPTARLKWKARGESGTYGYLVYRSTTPEGPFQRVSRRIVPSTSSVGSTESEYEFVDRDVEVGRTYYYYLDTVGNDGRKRRFSPVISKTVAPVDSP